MTRARFVIGVIATACGTTGEGSRDAAVETSAPRPLRGGAILVEATRYTIQEKTFAATKVSARFTVARAAACTVSTSGKCTTTTCPAASPDTISAGSLAVDGLVNGPVALSQVGTNYTDATFTTALFAGGETLHATATGADVPAFTRTVVAPPFMTLLTPPWPAGGTLAIPRSADLTFAWDVDLATVFVRIADGAVELRCETSGKGSSMVIPRALLAPLASDATLQVGTIARDLGVAGDFTADFVVTTIASRGGALAEGPVSLQ